MDSNIINNIKLELKNLYKILEVNIPEIIKHYPESDETFVLFPNNHAFNMMNLNSGFISAFSFRKTNDDWSNVYLYRISENGRERGPMDVILEKDELADAFQGFIMDIIISQFSHSLNEIEGTEQKLSTNISTLNKTFFS